LTAAQGRSIVAPTFTHSASPRLLRWDTTLPITLDNLACFGEKEAKRHEALVYKGERSAEELWGAETAELWARRQLEERAIRRWRI